MGFRTVVMLSNDMCHEWQRDTKLGEKIGLAMNYADDRKRWEMAGVGNYGRVVECCHADNQTLAMLDGYTQFRHVESQPWTPRGEGDEAIVRLLKSAARKLGYRLVKMQQA